LLQTLAYSSLSLDFATHVIGFTESGWTFLIAITDSGGFFIFLGLATIFLI